ncbi:MAG: TauD/TfdA family dioxygenase, partial [Alphaproteobacteria bacterium]|nr:TauD/TfdA family dioxygenase [Alphaproteobacteria bacterium]
MVARRAIAVVPTGAALGADIWNVDPGALDAADFAVIRKAWLDHCGVLRFPGQNLDERGLLDFGRRFGALDSAPISTSGKLYRPELPELTVISNVEEGGKPVGALGNYESKWHADMSYNPVVPRASILHAVEIPREGGNTSFCNMYRAYQTLAPELRARLLGYHSKHDSSHNSVGQTRFGFKDAFDRRDEVPGAVHPMVIAHPETGRPALFLGRRRNAFVLELGDAESAELLDFLWDH